MGSRGVVERQPIAGHAPGLDPVVEYAEMDRLLPRRLPKPLGDDVVLAVTASSLEMPMPASFSAWTQKSAYVRHGLWTEGGLPAELFGRRWLGTLRGGRAVIAARQTNLCRAGMKERSALPLPCRACVHARMENRVGSVDHHRSRQIGKDRVPWMRTAETELRIGCGRSFAVTFPAHLSSPLDKNYYRPPAAGSLHAMP